MIFATGLSLPEGPVFLPDGSCLVVEMGPARGCVTRISSDGQSKRVIAHTGRPNGLAVDREGIIWVAESRARSLLRLTLNGQEEVVATGCENEPFLFPNDLCFGPDGALYMTDSGIQFEDWLPDGKARQVDAPIDGRIYRIDIKTRKVTKLDSGIRFTNGIAFGPCQQLYVTETVTGMVYRYQWREGGIVGRREDFGSVIDLEAPTGFKGPDGIAFGENGKLFVTVLGQGDVTVLGKDGHVVERIRTAGRLPTNVAFGARGEKKIYVTEDELGQIEVFDVGTNGLSLFA